MEKRKKERKKEEGKEETKKEMETQEKGKGETRQTETMMIYQSQLFPYVLPNKTGN